MMKKGGKKWVEVLMGSAPCFEIEGGKRRTGRDEKKKPNKRGGRGDRSKLGKKKGLAGREKGPRERRKRGGEKKCFSGAAEG